MDARAIVDGRPGPLAPYRDRIRPAAELVLAVGALEWGLWGLRESGPAWLYVATNVVAVAAIFASWDRRRRANPARTAPPAGAVGSWALTLGVALGLSALLLFAARFVGDRNETYEFVFLDKPPAKLLGWGVGKFLAALGQQLALMLFLWPVCFELTRGRLAGTVAAATIFGLIHLPSPTLVGITLAAGLAWIAIYRRTGRIAPLVASHMLLAILAHGALPERLTYDLRVGAAARADMKRFEELNDPRIRLINHRLKIHRAELREYASDGYYARQGGTPQGYIRALYRDILRRTATDTDVRYWLTRPKKPTRDELTSFFLASDEYARLLGEPQALVTANPSGRLIH